jgi:mannitol-1-/sugar-/sorbitol-6-phosphatase
MALENAQRISWILASTRLDLARSGSRRGLLLSVCLRNWVVPSFSCEAILFDLDGVLVDSTPCVTRVWCTWAREHGLDAEQVVHVAHGQRTIETVREVAPHLDAQMETDRIEQMEITDTEGLRVLPGAEELLAKLPPDRYTIVTSGTRLLATKRLQVAGLPAPVTMITADDVTHGKPDPEPYLAGALSLGFAADRCLVLEDAPSGIRAATSAGMRVIGLSSTFAARELVGADLVIASLQDIDATVMASAPLLLTIRTVRAGA